MSNRRQRFNQAGLPLAFQLSLGLHNIASLLQRFVSIRYFLMFLRWQCHRTGWLKALNMLAFNGAVGYLTVNLLIDEDYADGLLMLLFLFQRYYLGNVYQAEQTAQEAGDRNSGGWRNIILQAFRSAISKKRAAGRRISNRRFNWAMKNTPRRS